MSLTSLLESSPILRARLLSEFTKPEFRLKAKLQAPPLSESYGLTGTAFDYLLRFYVQKLNPLSKTNGWVAEHGLARLSLGGRSQPAFTRAKRSFEEAQSRHKELLDSLRQRPN